MKLLLHIGTEKTGTTSVQAWMHANQAALLERGIWYPNSLISRINHRKLAVYAMDPARPDDAFDLLGIQNAQDHSAFQKALEADFADEYSETCRSGADWCVISSEHFHSRLKTEADVARVKAFLEGRFDRVEVMVHLRPQVDLAISLASTAARLGHQISPRTFQRITGDDVYYNYDQMVGLWENVFGASALHVVPFNQHPSAIDWISEHCGFSQSGLQVVPRQNEAVSVQSMQLTNNVTLPPLPGGRWNPNKKLYLDDLPVGDKLTLGPKLARRVHTHFEASNAALVARYDSLSLDDLEPNWPKQSETGTVWRLEGEVAFKPQLSGLVHRLNAQVHLEQARTAIARAELADLRSEKADRDRWILLAEEALAATEGLAGLDAARLHERSALNLLKRQIGEREG